VLFFNASNNRSNFSSEIFYKIDEVFSIIIHLEIKFKLYLNIVPIQFSQGRIIVFHTFN
jgi:hypothetical protein